MSFHNETFSPNFWAMNMGKTISTNKKKEILPFIKSHLGKVSQREIANQLNIGRTTINRWAKELGFKHKRHIVNEKFFNEFNENSSYILGLIYADGNVAWNPKKGYRALTITASAKDKDHLENIRKLLFSTKPLLYSMKTNSYRLIANSKVLCLKLMGLGVVPRKSLVIDFPEFLPREQLKHFIRGIIDGDGHVRYVKRAKSPYFEITISSGSEKFCQGFVETVDKLIGVKANIRKIGENTKIIRYSCSRGEKLAKLIYSDSNIYLKRKFEHYQVMLEEKNEHKK
jgi:hypothetical protein